VTHAPPGRRLWVIPEGYLPVDPEPRPRPLRSHEAFCLLNAGDTAAHVTVTVYFADREPVGPYRLEVAARRTLHARFDELADPEPIPRGVDYASVIASDVPIVVQHTRLDARWPSATLMTTIPWSEAGTGEAAKG
jgi:hypothetical protein